MATCEPDGSECCNHRRAGTQIPPHLLNRRQRQADSPETRVACSALELRLRSSPRTGILEDLALGRSIATGVLPIGITARARDEHSG